MKKSDFNAWLTKRVEFQSKVTMSACVGMAAVGLIAFIVQGGLLWVLFWAAYGSKWMAALIVLLIFGGMGVFTWLTAPKELHDQEHEVAADRGDLTVHLAPTLSTAWTYAMGSLDSDQSIPERIFGMMMIVPRMAWTSKYVFGRIQQVKEIDIESCGKVLRLLLKKSERVEASDVADRFDDMDVPTTLRQLSLMDGVVFLTKDSVGMTLANRFKDDLEKGLSNIKPAATAGASLFDE